MALVCLLLAGCTARHYRESADREVGKAVAAKSGQVPNMESPFTIEATNRFETNGLPVSSKAPDYLGELGAREKGAWVISLQRALETSVRMSRLYQSEKETVYLQGLSLSLARHRFTPLFSAKSSARYDVSTTKGTEVRANPTTGEPEVVMSDNLVERSSVSGDSTVGASWMVRDLGRISAAFTADFFRYLSGDPSQRVKSEVGATFARPLLRNAGFKAEIENLTLAERGLLYTLRDFVRFRKRFSVDVAAAYYRVLQARDKARNARTAFDTFKRNAAQTRARVEEGRVKLAELGRLEQQELQQETSWIAAVRAYSLAADNFKIQLGLPAEVNLVLEEKELAELRIVQPVMSLDDALKVALAGRMDLQSLRDKFKDNERAVKLAADGLKPQLDLTASAGINSREARAGFPLPDVERYHWSAGLELDPALDRKEQRNAYRSAMIRCEQARRAVIQSEEDIKLAVREDWRGLEEARRNYEISEIGVRLSERRVREQDLLAEMGRGRAQDQVDAQNDLTNARNQRTDAMVGHTIARLRFWEHLGILFIKPDGGWEELSNVQNVRLP